MKYERTINIWNINQLLYFYNNDRLIYIDNKPNETIIENIFSNHSIGSILLKHVIDKDTALTHYEVINGEQIPSIINYYINKNNWDEETKKAFYRYQFPVEIVYE